MSTQRLVYEGPDLEALLEQIMEEHGPVRLRPLERRRKGGFLGFFAREVYVVEVEPDVPAPAAPAAAGYGEPVHDGSVPDGSGHGGFAALLEATEDELELTAAGMPAAMEPPPPAAVPGGPAGTAGPPGFPSPSLLPPDAAAAVAGLEVPPKPFGQVLTEVASSLGEEPGTYRPPAAGAGVGVGVGVGVGRNGTLQLTLPLPGEEALQAAAEAPVVEVPAPVLPLAPSVPPGPLSAPAAQLASPGARAVTLAELLRCAGFPEWLLPDLASLELTGSALEQVFALLPPAAPLPRTAGGLVAVVGESRLSRPVARAVANELGIPSDDVAVASTSGFTAAERPGMRVRTPEEAAAQAAGWRRDRVGVVCVYSPPLGADQRWTRSMIGAVRPSCVWGPVQATTKPEDVKDWVNKIGGVDALVVGDVQRTTTPASVLSTGIPVARLDGEPATPQRWAAIVADLVVRL